MPLFKNISPLTLLDRKRSPEKYLKELQTTSRGLSPVPVGGEYTIPFPWAQLRLHTDVLLSKRGLSELERDEFLLGIIASSQDKIVVLAACSPSLSSKSLLGVLEGSQQDAGNNGQWNYWLQAFVAASHGNTEIFFPGDEAWATVLVGINHDAEQDGGRPTVSIVRLLLNKWCTSPLPTYPFLRNIVQTLTIRFLQKINDTLESCLLRKDWTTAVEYAVCLSEAAAHPNGLPREVQDVLEWEVYQWRQWTSWKPDRQRLRLWNSHSTVMPVQPFWNALGPDLTSGGRAFPTVMARVLSSGQLIPWLEENGLKPGFDIIVGDTLEISAFAHRLLAVLDAACKLGDIAFKFLQHVANCDEGLDLHSLQLWEDSRLSLFEHHSRFLSALLQAATIETVDDAVLKSFFAGLSALSPARMKNLKDFLASQINSLVVILATLLVIEVDTTLSANSSWLEPAHRLATFRAGLLDYDMTNSIDLGKAGLRPGPVPTALGLENLHNLQIEFLEKCTELSLHDSMAAYVRQYVRGTDEDLDDRLQLIKALHDIWNPALRGPHRTLALQLVYMPDISPTHRAQLIRGINALSPEQVSELQTCLGESDPFSFVLVCYRMLQLAANLLKTHKSSREAWQHLVRHVLGSYASLLPDGLIFTSIGFQEYRNWIGNCHAVFESTEPVPHLRQANLWVETLSKFAEQIESIRSIDGSAKASHCIYTAFKEPHSASIVSMLSALQQCQDSEKQELMRHCILSLTDNDKHAQLVSDAVRSLAGVSNPGFQLCQKLTVLAAQESVYIAAVQKTIWLEMPVNAQHRKALNSVALALRLPTNTKPETAKDYFMRRIEAVKKEAENVEAMRMKLSRSNRKGVNAVLTTLKIDEQSSALQEEIWDLPSDLLSNVEPIDEHTVELHFPLAYLSYTQRRAWGLHNGESVTVRLAIADDGTREAFCCHVVDPQSDSSSLKHDQVKYAATASAPDTLRCEGRVTRLTYMIMRSLWHWLRRDDGLPLAELYSKIDDLIRKGRNNCVVCNQSHPTPSKTYRPSVCIKPACKETWLKSALELRLADTQLDSSVVELLLTAVQAAANTMQNNKKDTTMELLPDRPPRLNDNGKLLTLLNTIPRIPTNYDTLESLYSIRKKQSIRAELLLSWATNNYRGFLMSAPPALQIPNMPGAKQFVVADSPPAIVSAFAQHDALQPRQVLFHGTTMDRLYAILCQGLKILSHTSFQSHGAAYGSGIYLAEAPATAVGYSTATACSSPSFALAHHDFVMKKVLLGIEYAGNDVSRGNGIHVATDPTKLLLRYVFLLPNNFKAPIATHVVPAMQSNFFTLKSGAR